MIKATIAFILMFLVLGTAANLLESKACQSKYQGYEPQYSFWGGCKVVWSGKLTPVDIIREIN